MIVKESKKLYPDIYCVKVYKPYCDQRQSQDPSYCPPPQQRAPPLVQWQRIRLPVQGMGVRALGREDPLEEETATRSSILAWRIPETEEPRRQSMGSQNSET